MGEKTRPARPGRQLQITLAFVDECIYGMDFMSGCSEKVLEASVRERDMNQFLLLFLRQ